MAVVDLAVVLDEPGQLIAAALLFLLHELLALGRRLVVVEVAAEVEVLVLDGDAVGQLLGLGVEDEALDEDDEDLGEAEELLALDDPGLLFAVLAKEVVDLLLLEKVGDEVVEGHAPA